MGMLLNGFVHTLMYNHYWKPWKTVVGILASLAAPIIFFDSKAESEF